MIVSLPARMPASFPGEQYRELYLLFQCDETGEGGRVKVCKSKFSDA